MKISTKGRYGLKAMIYIGANSENGCVSLRNISEAEGISENYLEQIIAQLKKDNLVKSVRGAYGGYTLLKEPKDISVGDILRSLEGSLSPVDCVDMASDKPCTCGNLDCGADCITREVWQQIDNGVTEIVDGISLQYLIDKYKLKTDN